MLVDEHIEKLQTVLDYLKEEQDGVNVIIGVYGGVVSDIFLIKDRDKARQKYKELREKYDITLDHNGDPEEDNENEVLWYYNQEIE